MVELLRTNYTSYQAKYLARSDAEFLALNRFLSRCVVATHGGVLEQCAYILSFFIGHQPMFL